LQANPSGGLQQTRAGWERFRGTVDINFNRMISWQGLSFHATGLWQSGGNSLLTPPEVIAAVHDNTPVPDAKLNALVSLVREPVRERGYTKAKTIQKFLAAGYTKEQVMEILLGIALKTISNYLDHISPTPLDP
jgi:hypothetical protein